MPALLVATADDPTMVAVTNKGYAITRRGLEELDKRGIRHQGAQAVADGHEKLDFGTWDSGGIGADWPKPVAVAPSRRKAKRQTFVDLVRQCKPATSSSPLPALLPPTITVPVIPQPTVKRTSPKTFAECCREIIKRIEK